MMMMKNSEKSKAAILKEKKQLNKEKQRNYQFHSAIAAELRIIFIAIFQLM
jgi:hypothetical protein